MTTRANKLKRVLSDIESELMKSENKQNTPTELEGTAVPKSNIHVVIGNSKMAQQDNTLVSRISSLINRAYRHDRIDEYDVLERLEMGDATFNSNRVLHLAFRCDKDARDAGQTVGLDGKVPEGWVLVGCCSSTFKVYWAQHGCGHWGLLSVDPNAQRTGVASALVKEAERRLMAQCTEVQIEYNYTSGEADSERLMNWYEGKLGFQCRSGSGRPRYGRSQFRSCRKQFAPELVQRHRMQYLQELRETVRHELAELEKQEVTELDLQLHQRVRLCNLLKRSELNGCVGEVLQYDSKKQRYAVRVDNNDATIVSVLGTNIVPEPSGSDPESSVSESEDWL